MISLQMALWTHQNGKLYLPPPRPVARVLSTDEYVQNTNLFFYAGTERLLQVGHPFFEVRSSVDETVEVPKVSGNQYRVLRVSLPDPNKFALVDPGIYDSEHERLVWRLRGLEIGRGGPLGVATTGNPLFNKYGDTENPNKYPAKQTDDNRQNVSMDPKQTQLFLVGCTPPIGAHWDIAEFCKDHRPIQGECPPVQLINSYIEDGDMCDIGFGACNFRAFQKDKSGVPLDIVDSTCKYPDFLKMSKDTYGDELFFCGRREQLYVRHNFVRAGTIGDTLPTPYNGSSYYISPQPEQAQNNVDSHIYFAIPSGSLTTSDSQLFNRPYWLQQAQGANNGICWGNQLFVTYVDNTRNTNFTLSVYNGNEPGPGSDQYKYKAGDFKQYLRHVEEVELEFIFQLCKVKLDADILAHINAMNSSILDEWQLAFVPPAPQSIEDQYRFLSSLATKCAVPAPAEKDDPYKAYNFWPIDLTERFTLELSQYPLGRRFLYQSGLLRLKRPRTEYTATKRVKRKRTAK